MEQKEMFMQTQPPPANDTPKRPQRKRKTEIKRAPINMKATPALRKKLEIAAKQNNRPRTQQVETILERYFDENVLPSLLETFFQSGRQIMAQVIMEAGNSPHKDVNAYFMARGALKEWIELLPAPRNTTFSPLAAVQTATENLAAAEHALQDAIKKHFPKTYKPKFAPPPLEPQGLAGILQRQPGQQKDSEIFQLYLKAAQDNGDVDAVKRFTAALTLIVEKEAAEIALTEARTALRDEIEKIERSGKKTVRARLSALGFCD